MSDSLCPKYTNRVLLPGFISRMMQRTMRIICSNSVCILPVCVFLLFAGFLFCASPFLQLSTWRGSQEQHRYTHAQVPAINKKKLNVFVVDLPREFNYGLLEEYWDFARTNPKLEPEIPPQDAQYLPYPEDPLIKQYSAEYWLLGDLMTPEHQRRSSIARRVWDSSLADVIFVPFFATLSAELQLHKSKGKFRHKKYNDDYDRQARVLEYVWKSPEWRRSGGRDHVFVLTDPVAMWHSRSALAPSVLLVVDFGGWYMEDSKGVEKGAAFADIIHHRQVSVLKDVIVPYTHLLPTLHPANDLQRTTLLYFKGARHRHRMGLVREKLWAVLEHEPGVILEEGFPNATGQEQALKGMRDAEFCLHPAGDTPTSCRLFDAIASLCIPVIVSDNIELPFEGTLDYRQFCIFVAVHEALQPKFLVRHLEAITADQRQIMRSHLADVQHIFEYENGFAGGIGPVAEEGAVNSIWAKILSKVPAIKEAVMRERRKPSNASLPARCQCL